MFPDYERDDLMTKEVGSEKCYFDFVDRGILNLLFEFGIFFENLHYFFQITTIFQLV